MIWIAVLILGVIVLVYYYTRKSPELKPMDNNVGLISNRKIKYYIYDSTIDTSFKNKVSSILKNSQWNKHYILEEVVINDNSQSLKNRNDIDIFIQLKHNVDLQSFYNEPQYYQNGKQIKWSFTSQTTYQKPMIYINADNWLNGVPESRLTLGEYREYVVNHEFGHALGYNHAECNDKTLVDNKCPVMYQSTRGCPENVNCGYQPSRTDLQSEMIERRYLK